MKNSKAFGGPATALVTTAAAAPASGVTAFTFGDAEAVLDRREVLGYFESWSNGRWYEPPVPMRSLARLLDVNPHHRSAIDVKRNLLASSYIPTPMLTRREFTTWVFDYLWSGNGYLERVDNMFGRPVALKRSLAANTRRGLKPGQFFFINNRWEEHEFAKDSVFQLMEDNASQEIYGTPGYLSALQSLLLNEGATLFRRRYYLNGAHAGFIFYLNEATMNAGDADEIEEALKGTKGLGQFKNLFIHAPGGKKDGVQIIPIGEAAAKDIFSDVKSVTRDDILAAHRVPPQLLGVVPANTGGFGDVKDAFDTFYELEIEPLQARFLELNEWLGFEAIAFEPRAVPAA